MPTHEKVGAETQAPVAAQSAAAVDITQSPKDVAKRFAATLDVVIVNHYLAALPVQGRSAAAYMIFQAIENNEPALQALAKNGFQGFVVSASKSPVHPQATAMFEALGKRVMGKDQVAEQVAAPMSEAERAAAANLASQGALRRNPKDGVARVHGFDVESLPAGRAQAVNKEGYVDEMRATKSGGEAKMRGSMTARTVGVRCAFEVGLVNPRTGKLETVVFKGVEDHRPAGFDMDGWYDTAADVDSEVLVCTGQEYGKGRPNPLNPMQMGSGMMERISAFDYTSNPDLKRRVEHYLRTGDTGNKTAK